MALKIIRSIPNFWLDWGKKVGFVPTMGAFHEGHLELMRTAKDECDLCVVSLFVNPTQFSKGEDYSKYPRDEARDFEMAESVGVDVVFAPTVEDMYPRMTTQIIVEGVSERWESEYRPGHFDGVATVVAKLFHIVRPHVAYFGLKDFQQCMVIKRMVEDLDFALEIRFVETIRDTDGLAMSSRNAYLSPELRAKAPQLFQALASAAKQLHQLNLNPEAVDSLLEEHIAALIKSGFEVDYFSLVDSDSLEPLRVRTQDCRLIAAARLGTTRLIDNCAV